MSDYALDELLAVACAEVFCGDGEILASGMGTIPSIGARLAKATFAPDLLITDGAASIIEEPGKIAAGYLPYRSIFDVVWSGRRHAIMGASQIDRFGNQNISAIGDHKKPKTQLLGARGAPGNTINHVVSYFIGKHTPRVFVERVDFVSGVGYDRAAAIGPHAARFHEIRRVISNLGVFDFESEDHSMRVRSIHPGVDIEEIVQSTGFSLHIPVKIEATRAPTAAELDLIRQVLDPTGLRKKELGP